jgi:TRAP-type C4-dicarboxylate transport system substrate-binding protein
MKNMRLLVLLSTISLFLSLTFLSFEGACAKPIVLNAIEMWPVGHAQSWPFETFAERINTLSKGELTIKIKGGPESIAVKDQMMACIRGVVDIASISPAFMQAMIPEIQGLSCRSMAGTLKQLEEKGIIDIYRDLSKKRGLYFLGVLDDWDPHMVFVNVKVQKPKDLAGLKIRVFPTVKRFIARIGAIPVVLPIEEVYTAMERGTVNGLVGPVLGFTQNGWQEVTKYVIFDDVLVGNMLTVINLNSWSKIPNHLQELILKTQFDMFDEVTRNRKEWFDKEVGKMKKAGMQFIEFSPADAKAFRELCRETVWDDVLKKSPEIGQKLKQLMPQ